MHPWLERVNQTIEHHRLLESGDAVLVGISGGADSVALLYALYKLKDRLKLSALRAAHLHHGLRGAAADRDEAFVKSFCLSLGIPLAVEHADVAKEAAEHGESIEEAGRRLRYTFFESLVADESQPTKIAVAHNADDQAETVLFHVIRGTGITGLRGIPMRRGRIVRPLLEVSSVSIREFCRDEHLSFMIDETNEQLDYARNRIRHSILPEMKKINPGVTTGLCRLAGIADEEDAFLSERSARLLNQVMTHGGYDAHKLRDASPVICKRALKELAFRECGVMIDYHQTEALFQLLHNGGQYGGLPNRVIAVCDHGVFAFKHDFAGDEDTIPIEENVPFVFHGTTMCAKRISYDEFLEKSKINKNFLHYCVSYDMITDVMSVRSRQTGDRMHPASHRDTKSLKKLFNEWKIPTVLRPTTPVICDKQGVVAVLGYAVDERAVVSEHSKQILYFQYVT